MCISFLHTDPDPKPGGYRLVVASNRDEYYQRPSATAFQDDNNIIGGRDMEYEKEGGMWLGYTVKDINSKAKKLCFSALLNITGDLSENAQGRGFIVKEYLQTTQTFPDYVKRIVEARNYHGYNFVAVELSVSEVNVFHHANKPKVNSVYSGKHTLGFGNSPTFSPLAKVSNGRYRFQEILDKCLGSDDLIEELIALLKDETRYLFFPGITDVLYDYFRHLPDSELKRRAPNAFEYLSSNFVQIESGGYGTRTHSIILLDYDWNIEFIEHTLEEPIDIKHPKWKITRIKSKI